MKSWVIEMVVEIFNEIRKLDERELLSYWIKGEYEEVEMYWKFVECVKEFGLLEEVVNIFKRFGDELKGYGDEFYKIYC